LSNLVNSFSSIHTVPFRQKEDYSGVLQQLYSSPDPMSGFGFVISTSPVERCLAAAVATKNRNDDLDEYVKGVEEPYEKLEALQEEIVLKGNNPSDEDLFRAFDLVLQIFRTKKVPVSEQIERINSIIDAAKIHRLLDKYQIPFNINALSQTEERKDGVSLV